MKAWEVRVGTQCNDSFIWYPKRKQTNPRTAVVRLCALAPAGKLKLTFSEAIDQAVTCYLSALYVSVILGASGSEHESRT